MFFQRQMARFVRYFIYVKIFILFLLFMPRLLKNFSTIEESIDLNLFADQIPIDKLRVIFNDFHQNGSKNGVFAVHNFDNEIFVYSAYLDLRDGNMGYPKIRILALMRSEVAFTCHFTNDDGEKFASTVTYYLSPENHQMPFKVYILSCTIPHESLISHLNFFKLERKMTGTLLDIPVSNVIIDRNMDWKYEFTVCIPTLFGHQYPPKYLSEFIEITSNLGADHFYVYVHENTYAHYASIFEFYKQTVTVLKFTMPYPGSEKTWNHGQLLVTNDCVYRNAGISKYVILNDLDEYFVPYATDRWSELLEKFARNASMAGYAMQTYYFQVHNWNAGNRSVVEKAIMATSAPDRKLTKCIVKPERIFDQGIHHVSRVVQDYYNVERMDEKWGVVHHYKNSLMGIKHSGTLFERKRLAELVKNSGFRKRMAADKVVIG